MQVRSTLSCTNALFSTTSGSTEPCFYLLLHGGSYAAACCCAAAAAEEDYDAIWDSYSYFPRDRLADWFYKVGAGAREHE